MLDLKCHCCDHVLEPNVGAHWGVLTNSLITAGGKLIALQEAVSRLQKRKGKRNSKLKVQLEHTQKQLAVQQEEYERLQKIKTQFYP